MPSDAEILYRAIYIIGILSAVLFFAYLIASRLRAVPIKWSRITSQLILYIVLLTVLALPPLALTVFSSALIFLGMQESFHAWKNGVADRSSSVINIYALITATIIPYLFHFVSSLVPTYLIVITISLFSLPLFATEPPQSLKSVVRAFIGIAFSSLFSLLVLVRALPHGLALCILLIFLTNATDSTAYLIGKSFGKRKLIPHLSPEKTTEGTVGPIMAIVPIAVLFKFYILPVYPLWQILVFALSIGLSAQLGDLIFSVFKRAAGIKDYGHLIPGHGGILDRFDSLVIATPIFYYVVLLVK